MNFTQLCLASIRYWYPNIPIYLIIDYSKGEFPLLNLLKKKWNIHVFQNDKRKYGWGFGKFEPLFLKSKETFLVLDADTIMTGPILNQFEEVITDFIVDKEEQPVYKLKQLYYDLDLLKLLIPDFNYPGYSFNTGQWVGTSGIFTQEDFTPFLIWEDNLPKLKYPEIFKQADQGLFNFLLQYKCQKKKLSVERRKLMIWGGGKNIERIRLSDIQNHNNQSSYILHYAGLKIKKNNFLPKQEVLNFFWSFYNYRLSWYQNCIIILTLWWLSIEQKISHKLKKII